MFGVKDELVRENGMKLSHLAQLEHSRGMARKMIIRPNLIRQEPGCKGLCTPCSGLWP